MLNENELKDLAKSVENDVFKDYLRSLSSYSPKPLTGLDFSSWKENRIRNIKVSKFVRSPDDADIDNLCQLFQAFGDEECTIALLYHHTSAGTETYFRIADIRKDVASPGQVNALTDRAMRIFSSAFSGAEVAELPSDIEILQSAKHIVSVTNLASEKKDTFVSIENLLSYPDKKEYSILLLAKPVNSTRELKVETDSLCSYLSKISQYESEQITENTAHTATKNYGASAFIVSVGSSTSETDGFSNSKTLSNYSVKHMLEQIGKSLERVEMCKALGGWKFATYILSDSSETAKSVAHQYDAVVRGRESNCVSSSIISWDDEKSKEIFEYLNTNRHPVFEAGADQKDLTVLISSLDLAHAMNFPRKSVPGFPVAECASFGRNIAQLDGENNSPKIETGTIWHMRHNDGNPVKLDTNLLTSHVFITGSTGSGKSNTVYQLLDKLCGQDNGKHFLVVEPTKGEYKSVFGGRPDVTVYGTNYKRTKLLKINPFSFPEGVQLFAHLDRLIEIFNACWPMYAAMPAVLKDAVERAYVEAGWDLRTSENKQYGRLFPTFTDVLRQIDLVMNESDYSGDSKGDYKGALKTRLKSLTNGIYSDVFGCDEISEHELFDENVIVDLSEIGPETTSLIMGMLVLKLQEYRMTSKAMNSELKHVTVLEEAHNLLKRTSTEQTSEVSNLVGKSVEMITNAIAEMRTYGECFMIVDQAPGALDPATIRNTNTKIVLRLPDFSDRELVGKSIGLNDYQIIELSKLERGVAAVYQSGWIESVLCKFDRFENEQALSHAPEEYKPDMSAGILLNAVLCGSKVAEFTSVIKQIKNSLIYKSALPVSLKRQIWNACASQEPIGQKELAGIAYELLNADALYVKKDSPTESEVAQQFRLTLQRYQISDQAMKQNNLDVLIDLLNQEHHRRETNYVYCALMGGVR